MCLEVTEMLQCSSSSTAFFFFILLLVPHLSPLEMGIKHIHQFPSSLSGERNNVLYLCLWLCLLVSGPVVSRPRQGSSLSPSEDVSWGSLCPGVVTLGAGSRVRGQRFTHSRILLDGFICGGGRCKGGARGVGKA